MASTAGLKKIKGQHQIRVSWNAASDGSGVGVDQYEITRNNATIASATSLNFSDTAASPGETHVYDVVAMTVCGSPFKRIQRNLYAWRHQWKWKRKRQTQQINVIVLKSYK